MSDKNKKYNKPEKKPERKDTLPTSKRQAISKPAYPFWFKYVLLGVIVVVTFFCYHYSLGNEFTNWDDDRFINDNVFIQSFSASNLNMMLFHDVKVDNYVPLTTLSYAINYHFSGLAPQAYFLTNIIIHIINSCLMFFLALMMFKAMEECGYGNFKWKECPPVPNNVRAGLAFFCTLAYAIHPMHVESVSWVAERKDVLYAFFYFAGMMAYIKYIAKSAELRAKSPRSVLFPPERIHSVRAAYLLVLSLYLLSILSKPMAVVFPFSLLAMDVLLKRDKITSIKNIILEKIPFICIAIVFAIITYHLQVTAGALAEQQPYNILQRLLFASNNFYTYIVKAFVPIFLSTYYPFPVLSASGGLPLIFYVAPIIALSLAGIPLYFSYRSGENNFRIVLFGLGFYFFNMAMVSQIINVGPTIMSDRYSYICYFGIFFPLTFFVYKILEKLKPLAINCWLIAISSYLLFLGVLCYQRTFVWHNSGTLWTDVIEKEPYQIDIAYHHLGHYYFHHGDPVKAYYNYREAITLKINDARAYRIMGIIMYKRKQYDSALYCYSVALKMDSNDAATYINRGAAYSDIGKYDLAMQDYKHSARLDPNTEDLWSNIAYTYVSAHQYDSAISYYNRVIKMDSSVARYYHYRGVSEFDKGATTLDKGATTLALKDFIRNLNMTPHDSECMFFLSVTYSRLGNFNNAYKYAQMALNYRYPVPAGEIEYLKSKVDEK